MQHSHLENHCQTRKVEAMSCSPVKLFLSEQHRAWCVSRFAAARPSLSFDKILFLRPSRERAMPAKRFPHSHGTRRKPCIVRELKEIRFGHQCHQVPLPGREMRPSSGRYVPTCCEALGQMPTPEAARLMAAPMLRCRHVVVHGVIAQPEGRSGRPRQSQARHSSSRP